MNEGDERGRGGLDQNTLYVPMKVSNKFKGLWEVKNNLFKNIPLLRTQLYVENPKPILQCYILVNWLIDHATNHL